jgi:hypothetical protein
MKPAASDLNIFHALKNSLFFCIDFPKKYWILSVLFAMVFVFNSLLSHNLMIAIRNEISSSHHVDIMAVLKIVFQATSSLQNFLLTIMALIVGFLMTYYAVRMAAGQSGLPAVSTSKSVLKSLWQLFCMQLALAIVAIPLYILFIIPGVWWSIKTSVSTTNLLCTNDGPIESIKRSFQLTDNRFWSSFGYLLGVSVLPAIVIGIVTTIITVSVMLPTAFSFHAQQSEDNLSTLVMNGLIHALSLFVQIIIGYFCQAWLYVYLKNQSELVVAAN